MVQKTPNSEYMKLGVSRIRTNFKEGKKICFIKTTKVSSSGLGFAADSYARLKLSNGQSSVIQRLLLQLPLRLGGGSPEMLLLKGYFRGENAVWESGKWPRCYSAALVQERVLEAAVLHQRKKKRTAFAAACFSRRFRCLFKSSRSCSTSPTLKVFLNVYKTLRWVSSSRSQLCQFPMFLSSPPPKPFL